SIDPEKKAALAKETAVYDDDWKEVVAQLQMRHYDAVKPGHYREEFFSDPVLRERHPDDLLYFSVPTSYRPGTATALVVFMHGGGKGSLRTAPGAYMEPADKNTPESSRRIGEIFETTNMIGVAASAPWN